MENLHLMVGLGNPGPDYERTRHNAGYMVVDRLAGRWGIRLSFEKRFEARFGKADVEGRRVLVCQPQTYMNASGDAVGSLVSFYRIALERLLVIVDDADLPVGELRLRPAGGTGGHHGLESIERCLGTQNYSRLRVGIGRRDQRREITGHVLGRFESTELALVDRVLNTASDQAACWLLSGSQKAMTQYNGTVQDPANEGKDK